jgi:SAM-dependent methyltransferase
MRGNENSHRFNYYREAGEQFRRAIDENREYFEAEVVVDLGSGGGAVSKLISKYVGRLYSVDISEDAIEAMRKNLAGLRNVEIMKVEERGMPFKESSVDLVFAANSFHDLPNGYEREIDRVLRRGGKFIDIDWKDEMTESGPPLSIRLSEREVKAKLEPYAMREVKMVDIGTHYMLIFLKS